MTLSWAQPRRVLAVSLLLFAIVGAVAFGDWIYKNVRITDSVWQRAWFCEHRHVECGGPDPRAIGNSWHTRETGYQIALGAMLLVGAGGLIASRRRERAGTEPEEPPHKAMLRP